MLDSDRASRREADGGPGSAAKNYSNIFLAFCFAIRKRDRLLARLPEARDILRGSLLARTIRHRSGCPKCERGEGHPASVLAVGYPGGRMRQISLRKQQVTDVKQSLENYYRLKAALEDICEINLQLLRLEPKETKQGSCGQ